MESNKKLILQGSILDELGGTSNLETIVTTFVINLKKFYANPMAF